MANASRPAAKRQASPSQKTSRVEALVGRRYDIRGREGQELVPYNQQGMNGDLGRGTAILFALASRLHLQKIRYRGSASGQNVDRLSSPAPLYFNDAPSATRIGRRSRPRCAASSTPTLLLSPRPDKTKTGPSLSTIWRRHVDISGWRSATACSSEVHERRHVPGVEDFDMRLVNYLADEFQKEQGIDLRKDKLALQRLKESAEKAKIELSSAMQTEINLPFITADATGPKHLTLRLTRAKFEALVDDLIQKTVEPCRQALKDAGLSAAEINEVVLVGGMTRMPKVQEVVKQLFGKEPHKGQSRRSPAIGRRQSGRRAAGSTSRTAAARRGSRSARHRTRGGVFTRLTTATHHPDQNIHVFSPPDGRPRSPSAVQGEREDAADKYLASSIWSVCRRPRGVPQVRSFRHDANGSSRVRQGHARPEHQIRIHASGGLSDSEIERWQGRVRRRRGRQEAQPRSRQEPREACSTPPRRPCHHGSRSASRSARRRNAIADLKEALRAPTTTRSNQDPHAGAGFDEARRGDVQGAAVRPGR